MPDLKTVHLDLPARTEDLRKLEIGSVAYLTGRVFTAREGVYKRAIADGFGMPAGKDALGITNFHCSPAARSIPTALHGGRGDRDRSFRFAQWLDGWFKISGCNIIIGKGGMTRSLSRAFRSQQRDLSHHGRLRHRRAARPRHQARRRRLLARRIRPRPGGVGALRREIRPVPGRERPCRERAFERENAKIAPGLEDSMPAPSRPRCAATARPTTRRRK